MPPRSRAGAAPAAPGAAPAVLACAVACALAAPASADVSLTFPNGTVLDSPAAYSPLLGSAPDFGTVAGPAWFAGNLCGSNATLNLPAGWAPAETVVFFDDLDYCDGGVPLQRLRELGVQTAVALYEFAQPPEDPNDSAPRYAIYPGPRTMFTSRVHGSDSQRFGWALEDAKAQGVVVMANVTYAPDAWALGMEHSWYYIALYLTPQVAFFWAVVPLVAGSALYVLETTTPDKHHLHRSLPFLVMACGLTVSGLKIIEYSFQFVRDNAAQWVPEIVPQVGPVRLPARAAPGPRRARPAPRPARAAPGPRQLTLARRATAPQTCYVLEETILLSLMLLLLLHWRQIVRQTRRGTVANRLDNSAFLILACVSGALAVWLVSLHAASTYHVVGWQRLTTVQFIAPAIVLVGECIASIVFGGYILCALLGAGTASKSSQDTNAALAEAERQRRRANMKRAVPLTRLVIVSGVMLAVSGLTSLIVPMIASIDASPVTYPIFFIITGATEVSVTFLVLDALSPISQKRRQRRMDKAASASGGKRTDGAVSSSGAPGALRPTSPDATARGGGLVSSMASSLRGVAASISSAASPHAAAHATEFNAASTKPPSGHAGASVAPEGDVSSAVAFSRIDP